MPMSRRECGSPVKLVCSELEEEARSNMREDQLAGSRMPEAAEARSAMSL